MKRMTYMSRFSRPLSRDEIDGIVNHVREEAVARGCSITMDAAAEGFDFSLEEN